MVYLTRLRRGVRYVNAGGRGQSGISTSNSLIRRSRRKGQNRHAQDGADGETSAEQAALPDDCENCALVWTLMMGLLSKRGFVLQLLPQWDPEPHESGVPSALPSFVARGHLLGLGSQLPVLERRRHHQSPRIDGRDADLSVDVDNTSVVSAYFDEPTKV